MRLKSGLVHTSFLIEEQTLEKLKELIHKTATNYNERHTVSSFVRQCVYDKIADMEKESGNE